jgi:uncharacterized membrane protein YidH (DUF202 family)
MVQDKHNEQIASTLEAIHALLIQTVDNQQTGTEINRSIHDLEKKQTESASNLLEHAAVTNTLATRRTDMAKERTALVREQTRLSTKSTELSDIQTQMSHERTALAGQRTNLSVLRTDFSKSRTGLAEQRNRMAATRTQFSEKRTAFAGTRTVFSNMRTALAQGRTYLALIRTGLAFFTLSIAFFRMFGLSWWSIFDGVLAVMSLAMTATGLVGYKRANHKVDVLLLKVPEEEAAVTVLNFVCLLTVRSVSGDLIFTNPLLCTAFADTPMPYVAMF